MEIWLKFSDQESYKKYGSSDLISESLVVGENGNFISKKEVRLEEAEFVKLREVKLYMLNNYE